MPLPVKAWQLLSRSTDTKGNPIAVVSTLMVPVTPYLLGTRPLLSYQVAIDSLGDHCMPSYSLQTGKVSGNTQPELLTMTTALVQGWAVVTTDFEGPRNAYGAGRVAGQAVLDGIRGSLRLGGTGLAGLRTPVGMMGYSGGGQATAWAAELHPTYAPELPIKGIASGGTPADLNLVLRKLDGSLFAGLMFGAVFGAGREYPELPLDTLLTLEGKALRDKLANQCITDFALSYPFRTLASYTNDPDPLSLPVAQAVIADASLGHATRTPVYLYHAVLDELIPIAAADGLKATWCAGGAKVLYTRSLLGEHVAYAATGAPVRSSTSPVASPTSRPRAAAERQAPRTRSWTKASFAIAGGLRTNG